MGRFFCWLNGNNHFRLKSGRVEWRTLFLRSVLWRRKTQQGFFRLSWIVEYAIWHCVKAQYEVSGTLYSRDNEIWRKICKQCRLRDAWICNTFSSQLSKFQSRINTVSVAPDYGGLYQIWNIFKTYLSYFVLSKNNTSSHSFLNFVLQLKCIFVTKHQINEVKKI